MYASHNGNIHGKYRLADRLDGFLDKSLSDFIINLDD